MRSSNARWRCAMSWGRSGFPWRAPGRTAVRLVKGAFADGRDHAFQSRGDIDRHYLHLADRMLAPEARPAGFRPVFGTHDQRMIEPIRKIAGERGWPTDAFEFEMLFGVRPELQRQLRDAGHTVRLYLPFGEAWWPYAVRRVGESPRNAWLLLRALAGS